MGTLEIVLIIIGAVLCIASFVIPAKKEELNEEVMTALDEEAKKMVAKEVESVRSKVDGITDETIQYAVEKAERSMERVSNEKIMAVSEYSDTVLDEIRKNHQGVVFLYDMLNDKQENVKSTVAETNKSLQNIIEKANDAKADLQLDLEEREAAQTQAVKEEKEPEPEKAPAFAPFMPTQISREEVKESEAKKEERIAAIKAEMEEMAKAAAAVSSQDEDVSDAEGETDLASADAQSSGEEEGDRMNFGADIRLTGDDQDQTGNNNEKILKMHKAGKSNMAIAKELGLGIGEVKLVIDLFR